MLENFVLKLVTGIALTWLCMPRKEVTDGFFRIQMLVVLGLCVLLVLAIPSATPLSNSDSPQSIAIQRLPSKNVKLFSDSRTQAATGFIRIALILAAVFSYAGHIIWKLGRRLPGAVTIHLVAGLCLISLAVSSFSSGITLNTVHQFISSLASASVLGATLTGMLLGHWYLTTPTMSIGPLSWFTRALMLAAVGRLLITCLSLLRFGFDSHDLVHMLWLTVRITGGILVPFAAAVIVAGILRFRNTQSATGVLFAALILVFMGEMSAALLERDLRIPY